MGVLGGAFNPPHLGHLVLAQEAASQLGLDEVLLVPVGESPYKRIDPEPGRELRLEMTRVAAAGNGALAASDLETARDGPSFTYRTLEELSEQRPGDDLFFLMGADVAAGLEAWREPARVLQLARLAIVARTGSPLADAKGVLERLDPGRRAEFIEMPEIGVSSSAIRRRVAEGKPIRYLVPDAVAELIGERELYRA